MGGVKDLKILRDLKILKEQEVQEELKLLKQQKVLKDLNMKGCRVGNFGRYCFRYAGILVSVSLVESECTCLSHL